MAFRKVMTTIFACVLLTGSLAGCGCQAKPQPTAGSEPVPETEISLQETTSPAETAAPEETAASTSAPVVPTEAAPEAATEASDEDDFWLGEAPEDTRPPIEVTVPDGTQPYTDYEQYMDMSEEEQMKFYDSFESDQAFFDWLNQAKAEYEKAHPPVIIDGSTNIELKP